MNPLKKLFKQTFIYGLATVLPRMLSFLLLPLYTGVLATAGYGEVSVIFAWFAIFNVVLAYGMETAFFRFYNGDDDPRLVVSTSLWSLLLSTTLFVLIGLFGLEAIASSVGIEARYIRFAIFILALDALVIIPFAWLRANEKPMRYAVVKFTNVVINLGLNIFFLLILPGMAEADPDGFMARLYKPDFEIAYIFIAMLVASGVTLFLMLRLYFQSDYRFDSGLWRRMMVYAAPVLIAGIAFTVNEVANRILLDELLPQDTARSEVGKYAACLKLALFMTLFGTAFRMGIEPFFFSHAKSENPQKTYAQITNYFVILGSVILLGVVVFADVLKVLFVRDEAYWEAMEIVPIVVLASFCLGIYHNLSVWYKITDRTKFGAYISSIGALLTLIINLALIDKIGYMASAWATLAAYGSMMLLSFFFGRRYYPIPYNMRKILFYGGLSILFSALSFYVFDRNLILGSLLLLLFLGLIYKMEGARLKSVFLNKPLSPK
ncbi:MAG: oligosaccharide flippase family protein [Flavobacteriaceae bacterium]|nr:oligosaccharide flippase family protein [Flavobacteriaceae bacterium]